MILPLQRPRWFLFGLGLLCVAAGADWTRFRGPNGTGVALDKDIPVQWAGNEAVCWKWPIPGTGNSSPVVAAGKVFVHLATKDGSQRQLHCLDAAGGKLLWTRSAPGAKARTNPRSSLASCTPAADGRAVYVVFWNGKDLWLCAYDFQGNLRWRRGLGPFKSNNGAGHSPIVYDGLVFLNNDQDGSASLLAFEAKTGKPIWQVPRKAFRACYSTPLIHTNKEGKPELVVLSTAGVTGYEPGTGSEIWHFNWPSTRNLRTVGSPIVANDYLAASSGDGAGARHFMVVKLGGKGDLSSTNLAWDERKSLPYVPSPLARGDYLYTVNDHGIAACHVLKTGEKVWTERLGSPVTASPILVDGKVYAVGEDGQVYVFAAASSFKLLGKSALNENVVASPAVADGRLYIRGDQHLFCIAKK